MRDLELQLLDYWDEIIANYPMPSAEDVIAGTTILDATGALSARPELSVGEAVRRILTIRNAHHFQMRRR